MVIVTLKNSQLIMLWYWPDFFAICHPDIDIHVCHQHHIDRVTSGLCILMFVVTIALFRSCYWIQNVYIRFECATSRLWWLQHSSCFIGTGLLAWVSQYQWSDHDEYVWDQSDHTPTHHTHPSLNIRKCCVKCCTGSKSSLWNHIPLLPRICVNELCHHWST